MAAVPVIWGMTPTLFVVWITSTLGWVVVAALLIHENLHDR